MPPTERLERAGQMEASSQQAGDACRRLRSASGVAIDIACRTDGVRGGSPCCAPFWPIPVDKGMSSLPEFELGSVPKTGQRPRQQR